MSARLRSVSGKGAGAWLQAILTSDELALKPSEFRLAACLRFGLDLPFQRRQNECDCRTNLDSLGYHLLTCKHGGGPIWAHDSVTATWSDCLKDLSIHDKKEPKHRYLNNDDRPDIIIFDTGNLSDLEIDVSLAHPWSKEVIRNSARQAGYAAKK